MVTAQADPSLPDWLQGWGTVTGSVFAALAAVAAVAVFVHDRSARRRDEADAAAAQARSVLVLIEADGSESELTEITLVLRNFSREIVFDVAIAFRRVDGLPPGATMEHGYLEPDGTIRESALALVTPLPFTRGDWPRDLVQTKLVFTDAAGRRWLREGRGQPRRLGVDEVVDLRAWSLELR